MAAFLEEFYGSPASLSSVERAAIYAGEARAMVANLYAAGNPEKARLWQAEEEVWEARTEATIQSAPLGKEWLASFAVSTMCSSFKTNIAETKPLRTA